MALIIATCVHRRGKSRKGQGGGIDRVGGEGRKREGYKSRLYY